MDTSSQEQHIHPLVRFAVGRRVTMGMLLLGVLVMGWLAVQRIPLEFLPTISSSNVSVQASYPSSSPEEISRLIVHPLEDSLGTLNGLDRMTAAASADDGRIDLTFVDGSDMDLATVEVRDRVDRVRHLLPSDLRQVRIRRFQTTDIPAMRFHLSGGPGWESERIFDYVERTLQPRLERLDGVAQITVRGLRTREVQVQLDPDRLDAHAIDVRQITSALRQNHLNLSAGWVREGSRKLIVRCLGELATLDQIRDLPLDGAGLRLGDVAEIAWDYPRQESFNFLNGTESLTVRVYKESGANLLAVVDRAKAELAALAAEDGFAYRVYRDSSVDVRKGLSQLRDTGLLGGLLAVLAVFAFLRRWRTTLLIAVAIPVSVVFTFVLIFLMRQAGWSEMTLNVVSLMGLVLALGMLVDNSIVVIESIYRHVEQLGEDSTTAALRGASEVALPILASTATTLSVFIPVIFLSGGGGGFFSRYLVEIGTTVCIVMIASLLVALTVVPMAAALLLGHEKPRPTPFLDRLTGGYGAVLRFTLRHRFAFVAFAGLVLYGSWVLFGSIERSFGSRTQARQVTVHVDTPRNYSLEQTAGLFDHVAGLLDAQRDELDVADISYSYFLGGGRARGRSRQRSFDLYLKDEDDSQLTTAEVTDRVRALLPMVAGVDFRIARSRRGPQRSGIHLELAGDDPEVLELVGREVAERVAGLHGIQDVDLSLESGDDEVRVRVDRERAIQAGVSSQAVAATVQSALSSRALVTLKTEDREVDLVMLHEEAARETLTQLRNVAVRAGGSGTSGLPLDALADFEQVAGPRSIERENRRAKITVTAETTSPIASRRAMTGIAEVMSVVPLPPGYTWSFGRWNRLDQSDEEGANFALLFAILLVYMLMASLFESFTHPISIMVAVPFAFIGVGVVMKLAGQARDNFTELGLIILIGVVVNNAIVLIDHVNRLRRQGAGRDEAVLLGGRHRLRAILMTAVTTILGLLPMVAPILFPQWFGPLEGRAGTWAPVALVILGGLTTSTFLTLMIVPTIYTLIDDVGRFATRVARAI
ncbi:MAG: efflux RND transporter permease subunit [bacterium]|nr:efflux RND transporter permease subunit [bacterium]